MRMTGKVALITGGAGGLCGATAQLLAQEGAHVAITDLADGAGRALAESMGGLFFRHDVADEAQWQAVAADVERRLGPVDVLVNGAGTEGNLSNGGALQTSLAEWRRVMSINLDGTYLGCRTIMPKMLERGTGSIINISSAVASFGTPTAIAYGASKAGVMQLTRSLALIGAKDGRQVRCNCIHPGVIKSRMTDSIISELAAGGGITEAQAEKFLVGGIPFRRRGQPRDVASMILFLAGDESTYLTGSDFHVDGGWHVISAG
jgi:3(or 17)beta-hydroxysteroid dehydrogenase